MEYFSIKTIEALINTMTGDYKKLLSVIKSMSNYKHIEAVRTYIDLYYKKNGIKDKEMIEFYLKVKKRNLNV